MPDLPTVGDFSPGYEASALFGVDAPRNTPTAIIEKLNEEINAGLADPKIKARFVDLGGSVLRGSPSDFGELIAEETQKWGKVIKFANIKPDRSEKSRRMVVSPLTVSPRINYLLSGCILSGKFD